MSRVVLPAVLFLAALSAAAGVNLIKDGDIGQTPLSDEFRAYGSGTLTQFEEPFTWNKCLKLEVSSFTKDGEGRPYLKTGIAVGGDAKTPGFPVKPGGKYRFAFELRGNTPRTVSLLRFYDTNGKSTQTFSEVRDIVPQGGWTQYRGTFKVPDGIVRAELLVELWHSEQYGRMPFKLGEAIYLDRLSVESVDGGKETWPTRVAVVGADGAELDAFRRMGTTESVAEPLTAGWSRADEKGLSFTFRMEKTLAEKPSSPDDPNGVWKDDHIEFFFSKPDKLADVAHFAVAAGGARWMTGDAPDYSSWRADVKREGDGWTAKVFLPWALVGYERKPAEGEPIAFNVARERLLGDWRDEKTPKGTRRGGWQWVEDTSWTFVRDGFGDKSQWGVLFVGSMDPYVVRTKAALSEPEVAAKAAALPTADPSADYLLLETLREENRLKKLAKEKLVVAQVPFTTDPALPYLPDELMDPQPVFRVRAAVNERTALPVAVANMTDAFEEYRVRLQQGWGRPSLSDEQLRPVYGFASASGDRIGPDRLVYRRGLAFRDSNDAGHGARYDVLARMNGASALPVPSKEAGLVWIEIDLRDAKPGRYASTLVVTPLAGGRVESCVRKGDGFEIADGSKEIPVELEVLPFAIPDDLRLGLNGYFRALSDRTADCYSRYDGMAFQVTPWFFDMKFAADGSVVERKLRPQLLPQIEFIRRNAKKIGKLPRVMVAYTAFDVFRDFHIGKNNPQIALYSDAFWTAYRAWIAFIDGTLREQGFADYTIEVFDEPQTDKVSQEVFNRAMVEARAAVPSVRLTVTSGVPHFFKDGQSFVDDWTFYAGSPKATFAQAKPWIAAKAGRTTSVYSCGTSMRQELYRYYRVLPWKTFLVGADFVSLYQFAEQNPGFDFRQSPSGGVIYDAGDDVSPSIRLEALYRGMQDVNYLRYLKRLATGDSPAAKDARAFVEKAVNEVVYAAPQDPQRAESVRSRAIDHILAVMKENAKK